jgi:hypothetical protein
MRKILTIIVAVFFLEAYLVPNCPADDFASILKSGLLGAGAGAVGGAASGAKGRDVWKGALAGAAVNVVGGALLEAMSQKSAPTRTYYAAAPQQACYAQQQPVVYAQPQASYCGQSGSCDLNTDAYREAYLAGYKDGYAQATRDGR